MARSDGRLNKPDYLVIDLDPSGNPFDQVITVARAAHKLIETAGGRSLIKTSGKTGCTSMCRFAAPTNLGK